MTLERYARAIRGEPAWEGSSDPALLALRANSLGEPLPARSDSALARRQVALRAVLEFRAPSVSTSHVQGAIDRAVQALAQRWVAVFSESTLPSAGLDAVDEAKHLDPSIAVEWQVQDAFEALRAGRSDDARALARRSSRIASSEGVLQGEYLANMMLARVRRHCGTPHYAIRILGALALAVPKPWREWVQAEAMVAGAKNAGGLWEAIDQGNLEAAQACLGAWLRRTAAMRPLCRDIVNFAALLDPEFPLPVEAEPFAFGAHHETPGGVRDPSSDPLCLAVVLARANETPRRVLRAALELIPDVHLLEASSRSRRLHEGLSVLLLGGARGLPKDTFFRSVYGFDRNEAGHDEILRGLVHRMRKAHPDVVVESHEERLIATANVTFAVPDPRCERTLEDRILTFLAGRNGRATAKEIATAMQIPLRTVQRSLGMLVDDGSCHGEPDGRRTEYVVDDTTFSEPTIHRLRGKWS